MQRWYAQEQETVKPVITPTSIKQVERRYDPQTVQRAVEIAALMQAEQHENLTTEDIEAIAAEAGIEPRFIRRALAIAETESVQQRQNAVQTTRERRLSRRARRLMFSVPLAYFVALFPIASMLMRWQDGNGGFWAALFLLAIPAALIMLSAGALRRPRQGAVAGGMHGIAVISALFLAGLTSSSSMPDGDVLIAFLLFPLAGASLGLLTAWLAEHLPHWLADNEEHPMT